MNVSRREREERYEGRLKGATRKHERLIADRSKGPARPGQLFHYTTTDALVGIVENGCFWATDYRYMNDASELNHGTNIFREAAGELAIEDEGDKIRELRRRLQSEFDVSRIRQQFFMVCFCEDPNLLSQWRAYGDRAGRASVSLGFETRQLDKLVEMGGAGSGIKSSWSGWTMMSGASAKRPLVC